MPDISRHDFADRVSAALHTTIGLYDEVFLFDRELLEALRSGEPAVDSLTKKVIYPSKEPGDSPGHKLLRRYVGRLYGPGLVSEDEDDDADTEDLEGEDEPDEEKEVSRDVELQGSGGYGFIKIVLYEGRRGDTEPHLLCGRIAGLAPLGAAKAFDGTVKILRKRLKHLLTAADRGAAGKWRSTKAKARFGKSDGKVAILIDKVAVRPLFEFRTHDDIARLATDLRGLLPASE